MATNDITGDSLISKPTSENYRNNYDAIFSKGKKVADEADRANDRLEKLLEGWVAEASYQARHQIQPTGFCLNCDEPLQPFHRWCDSECCTDWQKRTGGK